MFRVLKTLWGVPEFDSGFDAPGPTWNADAWDRVLAKIKADGFDGVECVAEMLDRERHRFCTLTEKHGLVIVCQIHTCRYPIQSAAVAAHLEAFRTLLEIAKGFSPVLVNAHAGYDGWTIDQMVEFYQGCLQIQSDYSFTIVHETHRRRCLFNPWITRDVLARVPELRVNCDLSHWVVVCERLFDDQPADKEMWQGFLPRLAQATRLIHARVGYDQGPQVPNPAAPEYAHELECHERWWDVMIDAALGRGDEYVYLEPEHGPAPYQQRLPFQPSCPTGDVWLINTWLGQRQRARFAVRKTK